MQGGVGAAPRAALGAKVQIGLRPVQRCKSERQSLQVAGGLGRVERPAQPRLTGPVSPTLRHGFELKGKPETGWLAGGINIRRILPGFRSPFVTAHSYPYPYPYPFAIVSAPVLRQGIPSVWPNRQPLTAVPQPLSPLVPPLPHHRRSYARVLRSGSLHQQPVDG